MSSTTARTEITIRGLAASHGIAYGKAFLFIQRDIEVPFYHVEEEKRRGEVLRFEEALLATRQQIQGIMAAVGKSLPEEDARIFDAHLLVLEDQALIGETIKEAEATGLNVETCFDRVSQKYVKAFSEIDDEYLKERAGDIRDVAQRVLQNLLGRPGESLARLAEERVIVANEISPSAAVGVDRKKALAFVTDSGSKTSHAVIVARAMKVPAVVGMIDLTGKVSGEDWILVDGYEGLVIINPTKQTLFRYGKIRAERAGFDKKINEANKLPSVTLDGQTVVLRANIETSEEAETVKGYFAEGVGLYRTEFLYLKDKRLPSEEEQYENYRKVVEALAPKPVVIRTLDLGGDKALEGNPLLFPKEDNPFLGFRAIRFCLDNVEIFKEQLRAILRASVHGEVQIMYPMVSGLGELVRANALLAECREELKARGVEVAENLKVGSMIEIPSAAAVVDLLAEESDFFSIGTNDLIQYLLAVDRANSRVVHLYEPTHPAVLRTIEAIIRGGRAKGVKVSVCGEMAGDPIYAALLLGLGADELSMSPTLIPAVRYLVRAMKMEDARELARKALEMSSPNDIYAMCERFYRERVVLGE